MQEKHPRDHTGQMALSHPHPFRGIFRTDLLDGDIQWSATVVFRESVVYVDRWVTRRRD